MHLKNYRSILFIFLIGSFAHQTTFRLYAANEGPQGQPPAPLSDSAQEAREKIAEEFEQAIQEIKKDAAQQQKPPTPSEKLLAEQGKKGFETVTETKIKPKPGALVVPAEIVSPKPLTAEEQKRIDESVTEHTIKEERTRLDIAKERIDEGFATIDESFSRFNRPDKDSEKSKEKEEAIFKKSRDFAQSLGLNVNEKDQKVAADLLKDLEEKAKIYTAAQGANKAARITVYENRLAEEEKKQLKDAVARLKIENLKKLIAEEKKRKDLPSDQELIVEYENLITEAKKEKAKFEPATLARGTAIGGFFLLTKAQSFAEFLQSEDMAPVMAPALAALKAAGIEIPKFDFEISPNLTIVPRFGSPIVGYEDALSLQLGAIIKGHTVTTTFYIANLNSAQALDKNITKDIFQYYDKDNKIPRKYDFAEGKEQEAFEEKLTADQYKWGFAIKIELPRGWISERYPTLKKIDELGAISPTFIFSNFPYYDPDFEMLIQPGAAILFKLDLKGPFVKLGEFTTKNKPYFIYSENTLIASFALAVKDPSKSALRLVWRIRTAIDFEELFNAGKISKKPSLIRRITTDDVVFEVKPSAAAFSSLLNTGLNTAFNAQAGVLVHLMTQEKPFYLRAGVTLSSSTYKGLPAGVSLSFYGKLDGVVRNIFGIDGIDMGNLGFQIDMDTTGIATLLANYAIPSPISGLGMRGSVIVNTDEQPIILDGAGAVTFKDNPLPDFVIRTYASSIPLSRMLSAMARLAHIKGSKDWNLPLVTLNDITLEFANRDIEIATKKYRRGFEGSASLTVDNFNAGGKIIAQLPEKGRNNFIMSGFMSEIDSRFIKISGSARGDSLSFGKETPGPFFYLAYTPSEKKTAEEVLKESVPKEQDEAKRKELAEAGEKAVTDSLIDTVKFSGTVAKEGAGALLSGLDSLVRLPYRYYKATSEWTYPVMMFTGHLIIKPWKYAVATDFVFSKEEISAKFETKIGDKYLSHISFMVPAGIAQVLLLQFKFHLEFAQEAVTKVREKMLGYFQKKEASVRAKIDNFEKKYIDVKKTLDARTAQSHSNESKAIQELREKIARKDQELAEIQKKLDEHKEKCSIAHLSTWGSCLQWPIKAIHASYKSASQQKNELQISLERELRSVQRSGAETFASINTQFLHVEKSFLGAQEKFFNFLNTLLSFEPKRIFVDVDGQSFLTGKGPSLHFEYTWKGQLKVKDWAIDFQKLLAGDDTSEFDFSTEEFADELFSDEDLAQLLKEE